MKNFSLTVVLVLCTKDISKTTGSRRHNRLTPFSNFSTEAEGYFIQLTDKGSKDDTFQIASNKDGAGDARNLDAILSLQNSSSVDRSTGNFQEIFWQVRK